MRDSPPEVPGEQGAGAEHAGGEFTSLEPSLRRLTLVRWTPQSFEDFAKVDIVDHVAMEEAMKSSDKEQLQKAIKEELKSLEDNGARTKTELPPGKISIPCKKVFKKARRQGNFCNLKVRMVARGFL